MALCSLCSSLPFTDFPYFSPPFRGDVEGDSGFIVAFVGEDGLPDPIGFPYHENIGALAESAKTCPLCAFVDAGVQAWLVSWNKLAGAKKFIKSKDGFSGGLPTEERLWLTQSPGQNQGFCVWAISPQVHHKQAFEGLYLLTLVGFSVEEHSPLKDQFPLRPLETDSGSSRSLDLVASWVHDCVDHHEECSDGGEVLLPTRILDVEAEGDMITLIDGSSISGGGGKYACLSYCWGRSPPYTTTRATIHARRSGMCLKEMPQTFRDTVKITRRLGLRYLWIDSLCICQDDSEDWAREAGRMADVYMNAHVVIAANRSSDSTGGCFHERAPRETVILRLPIMGSRENVHVTRLFPSDHSKFPDVSFSTEPLSERGWVLQERTMPQRTLHYNDRQMYLECFHGYEAEDGYIHQMPNNWYYQQAESSDEAILIWNYLIQDFGARKLTRATDKLPAMSGWAKKLQETIGADYVAGLWSSALIQGMAWRGEGERKPASLEEYTGPSWSWASYGGIAMITDANDPDWNIAEVIGWHVELKEEANPFGEVRDAWIKIRGPVFGLKPSLESYSAEDESRAKSSVSISGLTVDRGWHKLCLDNQSYEESGEWRNGDLQVILLCGRYDGETLGSGAMGTKDVQGIVFREAICVGQRGKMERVGYIDFLGDDADRLLSRIDERYHWKTITLV